jgi:nondiscriminating aspartyl-tRNA synthetase
VERSPIHQLPEQQGQHVCVQGFVHTVRDQKAVQFVVVRDRTGMVQLVIERNPDNAALNDLVAELTRESAVTVTGVVAANPRVRLGGIEIHVQQLVVESLADPALPIDIWGRTDTASSKRLDWRYLDLRQPRFQLLLDVQTTAEHAMRTFWVAEGFVEIHSPKIMGSPSESGAELFALDYFGQTAFLAQSPQFYKQMAMAAGLERVFEIGPVFRADPSQTTRHAAEFTSIDMEMSWIASHQDVMALEERWLQFVLARVQEAHGDAIAEQYGVAVEVPTLPFPRVTMAEAQALLRQAGYTPPADSRPDDLDPGGERVVCEAIRREHGHAFCFVTDYPVSVRPFYHMRQPDDPTLTRSFDLLWKGVEITTGAQREHRYDVLQAQALEKGMSLEPLRFYLDFFRYGCPPHGGLGFGLGRMLMILLEQPSLREVTFLHRGLNRLIP